MTKFISADIFRKLIFCVFLMGWDKPWPNATLECPEFGEIWTNCLFSVLLYQIKVEKECGVRHILKCPRT